MAFVARASRLIGAAPAVAFDCLADHDSWARWMPASYRPVGKALGRLEEGVRLRVKVLGVPFPVSVRLQVVRRPDEICWSGGVKGVLFAVHRFSFLPKEGGSVEVRSEEAWSGFLASLLRTSVEPRAERVGRDQLAALAAEAEQHAATRA